jgi:hypothetical protein
MKYQTPIYQLSAQGEVALKSNSFLDWCIPLDVNVLKKVASDTLQEDDIEYYRSVLSKLVYIGYIDKISS